MCVPRELCFVIKTLSAWVALLAKIITNTTKAVVIICFNNWYKIISFVWNKSVILCVMKTTVPGNPNLCWWTTQPTMKWLGLQGYWRLTYCLQIFNFIIHVYKACIKTVIIIIIDELGLNRLVSASSNSLFKCLPKHLRSFVLYLTCFSFVPHVVFSVICMSLVSRQLVLLLSFSKLLFFFFCGQTMCIPLFFWKIPSKVMSVFLHVFVWVSKRMDWASALYCSFLKISGTK